MTGYPETPRFGLGTDDGLRLIPMRAEKRKPRLGFFPSCGCAMECPKRAWPRITCTVLMIRDADAFLRLFFARSA